MTANPLSRDEPRRLLAELRRLVAERGPAEVEIEERFAARTVAIEKEYQASRQAAIGEHANARTATEAQYRAARRQILAQFETDYSAGQREYEETRNAVLARAEAAETAAKTQLEEARWEATTVLEAGRGGADARVSELKAQLDAGWQDLLAVEDEAARLLRRRWQWRDFPQVPPAPAPTGADPVVYFSQAVALAKERLQALHDQALPRLFEGAGWLAVPIFFWLVAVFPTFLLVGSTGGWWIPASILVALVLWAVIGTWLFRVAKNQSAEGFLDIRKLLADADLARQQAMEATRRDCERLEAAARQRLQTELAQAQDRFDALSAEISRRRQSDLDQVDQHYPAHLAQLALRRDRAVREADEKYPRRLAELDESHAQTLEQIDEDYIVKLAQSEVSYRAGRNAVADRWQTGLRRFQAGLEELNCTCNRLFPDWSAPEWDQWTLPNEVPPTIRFGQLEVDLAQIEGALPADERLRPPQTSFLLPAFLPFPDRPLVMLKAGTRERGPAVEALQAMMLRMLTAIPPAKIWLTIIDPVGLGQNFSAFMHMADYDEQLVSSRIWTDVGHIEQRLGDMTEYMETVLQVYLRNEYPTIQAYNEFAGEMAEPYRVLVVANFPANFSEVAARRLASIVASGARCGVYTLMSVDPRLQMPRDFHLADLEPHALPLVWKDGRFVWEDADFASLPLTLEKPPGAERFTDIVRVVGRHAKHARRVEVPFACVAPEDDQWWTHDSREGIDVALGRAGAMKLQYLRLGKGTSQHVLLAGKTGSGKSTLLHALVTNLALHYRPDEVELYLVDFKKGVEFKTYAEHGLPHARVIAIESEREFGLSVLERLDAELRTRGDLFRSLGVQDLSGYRAAQPDKVLPRVLLVVDEFQEFFVEDDRTAQNAALLLDRLVRQGRAFGIHVLLGSQTLAGSYTLPRSTLGQMAVRIALQCSDADAHLILSEENTAARLLTRPGEAIYNDANGLYEGNHPFQVVWLPDSQREQYLQRVRQLAGARQWQGEPPIVFEGNLPADPSQNRLLREVIASPTWPDAARGPQAWLGAAVAIKDPTAVMFFRQSGANLLMVGHREEAAMGTLATCLISLAAQNSPGDPGGGKPATCFFVLDGTRPDAPESGFWNRLAPVLPHAVQVAGPRGAAAALATVAAELARRESAQEEDAPPLYLFVYNLGRFRDLRKEDDFAFSRFDEDKPPSPAKQLGRILREGPPLGIHTLIWSDTYENVNRAIDRQGMQDLELRVVFQMSAGDSNNLIDSSAASLLGIHRALLYDEGLGRLEKFRPYGQPSADWLAWVAAQLRGKGGTATCTF